MNSMTGYGRGEFRLGGRCYRVELRSYNNRFLDVKVRLPWTGKALDVKVEAAVRRRIHRGRVEVSAWEMAGAAEGARVQLDEALAGDLALLLKRLGEILGSDMATAARLLPPLRELALADPTATLETDEAWASLEPGLEQALQQLTAMRREEGQATATDVEQHLEQVETLRDQIARLAHDEPELHRRRLLERLEGWRKEGITVEPERMAQEATLLADRCDVSEELARLESHIQQQRGLLRQGGAVGRKMEFLLQEFNRELNTIASKSLSAEVAHLVVQAKTAVERMREQSQNVE